MAATRANLGRTFVGLLLLVVGAVLLMDLAGWLDAGSVIGRWWPTVIVAAGLVQMLMNPRAVVGALILIGFGGFLLLFTLGIIGASFWAIIWPLIIIVIGASVLLGRGGRTGPTASAADRVSTFALFGGNTVINRSPAFEGGWAGALFGGVTLDLRGADLLPVGATIDAQVAFGSVTILVPKGWNISIGGLPIFGGYDDKTRADGALPMDAPTLRVNVVAMFGGVTVQNEP